MPIQAKKAFESARLGTLELSNRFIKAATFEGKTPDGIPGEAYARFHEEIARGGVAMTTLAYCATEADGRITDQMMYMHEGIREPLKKVIVDLQKFGTKVSGQLVHCGNFSRNSNLQRLRRPLGPSPRLNLAGITQGVPFAGAMAHKEIDSFIATYDAAARFMKSVGFDAIELHVGHGYALSQFISPKTNMRTDEYGGSFENRMRLPLKVLSTVRQAVGGNFPILAKMNLCDGVKGGLELGEAIEVAVRLDTAGVDAIVMSGGTSSFNVMKMFRGDSFLKGLIAQEQNPLTKLGMRLVGKSMFKPYPYQELYFLEAAKKVKERVECPLVYVGGCSTLQSVERVMSEGFEFIQLGRPLLKDPAFVKHAKGDPAYDNGCTHCNQCVPLIDAPGGIRCVLNEPVSLSP
jgi:2,4-dienoyl-CoA reductase-like NADH-dependent reductase (Old Yellow Enzyme family)